MKTTSTFLTAVTVLTLFYECFTMPANFFTLAANGISSAVGTAVGSVSNVAENIKSITEVEVDEAEKQYVCQNIDLSELALERAKKIIADALLSNATGMTKASLTTANVWLKSIQIICDLLHPQMKDAIASSSVLALNKIVIQLTAAIKANEAIMDKFDEYFPVEDVKAGVCKEIKTILDYANIDLDIIKEWLLRH